MNSRTRTLLPTTGSLLEPRALSSSREREKLKDVQKRQARYYNADARDLPELNEGATVRLKPFVLGQKEWKRGVVVERLDERSYEVETADGSSYRRNRAHLKKTNESRPEATSGESQQIPDNNMLGHGRRTSKLPPEKPLLSHHKCQATLTSQMSPHFAKNQAPKAYHVLNPTKSQTQGLEPGQEDWSLDLHTLRTL